MLWKLQWHFMTVLLFPLLSPFGKIVKISSFETIMYNPCIVVNAIMTITMSAIINFKTVHCVEDREKMKLSLFSVN